MFDNDRLKKLRKEAGYTQSDIAAKLNVKRETYTRYETGSINPPSDMILSMANIFNVSADYLLNNIKARPEAYPGQAEYILEIEAIANKLDLRSIKTLLKIADILYGEQNK